MNDPRPMLLARQVLRACCVAVIFGGVVAGCHHSSNSSGSNAASATPSAVASSSTPVAAGTDTRSRELSLKTGTGVEPGSSGLSVPVKASAYGSATTVPFMVSDSVLLVSYSFNCSAGGGSGFTADLISGSAASPGSDDEPIADESGTGDTASVTLNPQDTPGDYYIQVESPCAWAIDVENG
jgi:hypothetical protein